MRNISSAFARALSEDKRDYKSRLVITLADNTRIDVDNTRIWDDGIDIQDAVSNDNVFQIGAAIINQVTIILNNIYGDFDSYSFDSAKVIVFTGLTDLDDGTSEELRMGTFIVDETKYNGSLITLTCVDNMSKFDKAYNTNLLYPATLNNIVIDACAKCGVTFDTGSLNFPHKDYVVTTKPSAENTTYRQVISWAAQIAGCFARCNSYGYLSLDWYETSIFDNIQSWIDGGVFDGVRAEWLVPYMNTDEGMTTISSTTSDDTWFRIDNSIGIEFNENIFDYLYIDSDSCYAFSNTQPSNHGHSSLKDVNVCTRDGQSTLIKHQVIADEENMAIKVRFHGYTRYGSGYQLPEYELEYEIFFTNNKEIVINFIKIPSNSSYLGTSSIIENTISKTFTPIASGTLGFYKDEDNKWNEDSITSPYLTGDTADGGSFSPWNTGDVHDGGMFTDRNDVHFIKSSYSSSISTDDVVITGVKVIKKIKEDDQSDTFVEYMSGTAGYVVVIENNDFIDGSHGQDIANWLGNQVNGLQFRKAELTHPNDPSIEAGDVAIYIDIKNRIYPILVSSTSFSPGNSQRTVSSAETPAKNSAQRFTEASRNYVEIRKRLTQQKTEWEQAEEELAERIANASGLYYTEVQDSSGAKIYYHNKANLNESDIVMLFTTAGFTMTANYQATHPTWYGMTVDGTMIAGILNSVGVNADWIRTGHMSADKIQGGTLTLGGNNNVNGTLRILNASGQQIGTWNKDGIDVKSGGISGSTITGGTISGTSISGSTISGTKIYGYQSEYFSSDASSFIAIGYNDSYGHVLRTILTEHYVANQDNGRQGPLVTDRMISFSSGDLVIGHGSIATRGTGYSPSFSRAVRVYQNDSSNVIEFNGSLNVTGTFTAGSKLRVIQTSDRARDAYCYEMTSPIFGDIGSALIGENGTVIVDIDPVFQDFISDSTEYYVFLQNEGDGNSYISEKHQTYFVITGTPNLRVAWELKGKQVDCNYQRMEFYDDEYVIDEVDYEKQAFDDVMEYLNSDNMEVTA